MIQFDELRAVDREKIASRGLAEDPFLGIGSSLLYSEPEVPVSALVPEPEYPAIEWDAETRGRFTVDGSYDVTVNTYQYSAEQVHPSAEILGRTIREQHEFTLSGLTDWERAIVTEAIENERGWVLMPDESPPDALYSLIDRSRNTTRCSGNRKSRMIALRARLETISCGTTTRSIGLDSGFT